ncbi:MAG: Na/Pi cotransporter family protein [Bulleidia sp.]|nr:Na/Pi cotransporter family protein [Bulleidia sp.]
MNETVKTLFGLFGGLAVFLYGMNMMSDSLQKAAGEKMKAVLGALTRNPFLGVLSGALVTAVLQSSSATTVMAIGFVSAGLMTLPQAISIIFGANIGTTMTAQLIAFKISDYIYLFIFIGFMISFISKKEKTKYIGDTILAFGLLFLGIETMGTTMKPLASSPFFVELIGKVSHVPILGLLTGLLMTLVVQSSSATIAVLQNFAAQPLADGVTSIIGLAGAIPVLLGDNIGTTITALLASIGQSKDAKRTALAHSIFNISGSLLFIWFVKPYASIIQAISPKGPEVEVISRQIANAHTGFNLVMTLIWTPLLWLMVKIVMKLIPDTDADKKSAEAKAAGKAQFLDNSYIHQPALALHLVCKEVLHCADMAKDMLKNASAVTSDQVKTIKAQLEETHASEAKLSQEINDYVASVFSAGVLTEEQSSQATLALFVLSEVDRVAANASDLMNGLDLAGDRKYSEGAIKDLRQSAASMLELFNEAMDAIVNGKEVDIGHYDEERTKYLQKNAELRQAHMDRVKRKECDARMTKPYNALLSDVERIGNSCINLAEFAAKKMYFTDLLAEPEPAK